MRSSRMVVLLAFALVLGMAPSARAADPRTFTVTLTKLAGGISPPTAIAAPKDGSGRLFINQQTGLVRLYRFSSGVSATAFLNITDRVNYNAGERGLLGLTFHPSYSSNGFFFVSYNVANGDVQISRFTASPPSADTVDPATEFPILTIPHTLHPNHNGGNLLFGKDGYLYITTGDGGGGGDPENNAQNLGSLSGKMLRIGVNSTCGTKHYCIPQTNPFNSRSGARHEIWHYGLRNPWKASIDRSTGNLYIADVGQDTIEEVDVVSPGSTPGLNFGWDCFEGTNDTSALYGGTYCATPPDPPTPPVYQYDHSSGRCSVTGGYVYRGNAFPIMQGTYLYADYCTGEIWGLAQVNGVWVNSLLLDHTGKITTFGEGAAGELYAADYAGAFYRVIAHAR